ncbi:MAG: YceD family protein [Vicinamibacterales bacterium]
MRLDLSHIRQSETSFDRRYEPDAFAGTVEDYRVTSPVVLQVAIHKDKDRFRLVGRVQAELGIDCSRCLERFLLPVDREFDLRYLPMGGEATARADDDEDEVADDDVSITFYRDDEIDIGELLREQFYLALPMKPLCRPDCRGICPHCGGNRNVESCECESHWEDPRLAGLKTLITNRKQNDA